MPPAKYRDVQEVAEELGVDVQTVRRWIHSGALRAYKPGKEYRIRQSDLEEFLRAREARPKVPRRSPYERSFNNHLAEERLATLLESRIAEARRRIDRYDRTLSKAETGQFFATPRAAGEWAIDTQDDLAELYRSISGELVPAYLDSLDEPMSGEDFREVLSVSEQLSQLYERLSALATAVAESEAEKEAIARRRESFEVIRGSLSA